MDTILLVDDDEQLNAYNEAYLKHMGYQVRCAKNQYEAMDALSKEAVHLVVLDVQLPQSDGFTICQEIKRLCDIPVIFLSNMSSEADMEEGFESGGIDYMFKPFHQSELELRIRMRLRQHRGELNPSQTIVFGVLKISLVERQSYLQDVRLNLTASEFDILVMLAKHPKTVYTIAQIYQEIWKLPDIENAQTVQVHIAHLRKKMEQLYPAHSFIQTVWGKGYTFQP